MDMNVTASQRESEFYHQQVRSAQHDLDESTQALAQFSSTTATLEPDSQGKAMVDAARLQGQLILSEADLRGLQQIYSDQNQQIASAKARVKCFEPRASKTGI